MTRNLWLFAGVASIIVLMFQPTGLFKGKSA